MAETTAITLFNGRKMPVLALGQFYGTVDFQAVHEPALKSVRSAIDMGYRHIDTAYLYNTERAVGQVIKEKIETGVVKREDIFVTTKLWLTHMKPSLTKMAIRKSLKNLDLDYIDLYLIHWPMPLQPTDESDPPKQDELLAIDEAGYFDADNDTDFVDTWKVMESSVDEGLCRAIGISNFTVAQMERLLENCRIKPAVHQIEVSPFNSNDELVNACFKHDIAVSCYRPFVMEGTTEPGKTNPTIAKDETLKALGKKYNKSPYQVTLRCLYQRGLAVIVKSENPERQRSNMEIFDFKVSDEDMKIFAGLNVNYRHLLPEKLFNKSKYKPY